MKLSTSTLSVPQVKLKFVRFGDGVELQSPEYPGYKNRFYERCVAPYKVGDFLFFIIADNGGQKQQFEEIKKRYQLEKFYHYSSPFWALNPNHNATQPRLFIFIIEVTENFIEHCKKVINE